MKNVRNISSKWPNLPSLVLENIFSNLDIIDRYEASLVCTNWYSSYKSSKLSTRLNLNILYSPKLIKLQAFLEKYLEKFSEDIKYLRINICDGDLTDLGKYLLNFSFVSLFNQLCSSSNGKQLLELEIVNLKITNLPQFISGDIEMIHALKQYLKTQNSIKCFSFKDSDIPDEITFSIVETMLNNCFKCIETLRFCRIFEKIETYESKKFVNLFSNLVNLKEIEINYHYLSKELLVKIIESAKYLKVMKLYINSFMNKSENTSVNNNDNTSSLAHYTKNSISSHIWNYVYAYHPNLQVTFIYEDCGVDFINLLKLTINNDVRLQHLFIKWAYIRMHLFKSQFSEISTNFCNTLKTFDVSLFIKSKFDIQCLFEFVDLASKQIETVIFKFDTDDLPLIEYSLQKFKRIIERLKFERHYYLKNLKKFHLFIDISSIGEQFLVEFQKVFKKIDFNLSVEFSSKSKFLLTFCNFSIKNEYSIES